ncbi:MAG: EamA family transporter [Acidimicrobiales bacterium]
MTVVVLALVASLSWGASDFLGGLGARRASVPVVLAGSQLVGLALFMPALLLWGPPLPRLEQLAPALTAGVVVVAELGLIYMALRRGPTVVMAPIAALSALVPVAVALSGGEHVDAGIGAGVLCALVGTVAASWSSELRRPGHLREALATSAVVLGAAAGTGTVLTLIAQSSRVNPWWAVGAVHVGGAVTAWTVLAMALLLRRARGADSPSLRPTAHPLAPASPAWWASKRHCRPTISVIAAIGLSDLFADAAYANATHRGPLGVVAVLSSLYPVTTIALGVVIVRERPTRVQLAGVIVACAGVAILSAAS